jgi:beta-lactam-binding protein with PASTA domain
MKINYRLHFFTLIFVFLFFILINFGLKKYTLHANIITVPSLLGLNMGDAEDTLLAYNLDFVIIDSAAYNPDYERGSVVSHTPKSASKVKPGRKIYLTINPLTVHYIKFPELTNKSLRQTISLLKNNSLIIGNVYYVDHFAKDVLRFAKMGDKNLSYNDSLPKFSTIDLYLGNGYLNEVSVPNLIGLHLHELKQKLNNNSLNVGAVETIESLDSLSLIIYKQEPDFNQKVPLGSFVSVFADTVITP